MEKNTSVIINDIYPLIDKSINSKVIGDIHKLIGNFIVKNHDKLYDNGPYHRLYHNSNDINELYNILKITEIDIVDKLQYAFFWNKAYNPPQIKEPFVVTMLMLIRNRILSNDMKSVEQYSLYLALSGKFYPSLHGMMFPKFPPNEYRSIMEYVVNVKLSNKFLLKAVDGTLIGAIKNITNTWINTYKSQLISKNCDDEDCGLIIQQLRDRIKSFLKNIAELYYESYERKDYFNYESDDYSEDNYRVTSNDSIVVNKFTDKTMNLLSAQNIDLKICKSASSPEVKPLEVKSIMEDILSDRTIIPELYKVINIIITDYLNNYPNGQLSSLEFIVYSTKAKPNIKDKDLIYVRDKIYEWLNDKSANYRRRCRRLATKNNYYNGVNKYLVLTIQKGARNG